MRKALLAALFAAAIPALAQEGADSAQPAPSNLIKPTYDTHTVQRGDTLWDICAAKFNNPFAWPQVWAWNPEITNPHWIYPGDQVRFFPAEGDQPRQTTLAAGEAKAEPETPPPPENVTMRPPIEVIDTAQKPLRPTGSRYRLSFFVTPKELAEAGTLANARLDKAFLARTDEVFLDLKGQKPALGQRYLTYKTIGEVFHPTNHRRVGFVTRITGITKVVSNEGKLASAVIENAMSEVERGNYVTPLVDEPYVQIVPTVATSDVQAIILKVQMDGETVGATHDLVVIDKGTRDGLARGWRMAVLRRGDPLTGRVKDMPWRQIATLLVLDAKETASTCVVLNARNEITSGDMVRSVVN
jgi:hypothetical protein